jgi:transporter family-2 protein
MYMFLALAAGAGLAFQAVINTRLRGALGNPLSAAIVQGVVGLALLAVLATLMRPPMPLSSASRLPWWIWTGGLLGTAYVLAVILTTAPLGAALMMASVIVGQTTAALVIDHYGLLGVDVHPISPLRLTGVFLLIAGVLLIRAR